MHVKSYCITERFIYTSEPMVFDSVGIKTLWSRENGLVNI